MDKKILLLMFGILLVNFISAADVSYCCEKTNQGDWCLNAPEEKCDSDYRMSPTSCESTSYCKLGCCYDSEEGTCMENTPQKICEENDGAWKENADCEIPQCELGCCLMGSQASFVTQTRCKKLSSLYGLENNFRTDIDSELECIASATADVEGACVYEKDNEKTCERTTKKECNEISPNNETEFYEGMLCSNEKLGTNCGMTERTTCVEEKDEVYFVDSCGNIANVYDASKINDKNYWKEIIKSSESCNPTESNADSPDCGNCDYYLGSTCMEYQRGEDKTSPDYGDYICRDLGCEYKGEEYEHGETWCGEPEDIELNNPGGRHFRLVCYNGEVTVEPCADFRQEICKENEVEGFSVGKCVVNKWQDCYSQKSEGNCEDEGTGDCKWIDGVELRKDAGDSEISDAGGSCVPEYPPGFNFWGSEEAEETCSIANKEYIVEYTKSLYGDWECEENCEYVTEVEDGEYEVNEDWENEMKELCSLLGDCGSKTNYFGFKGSGDSTNVKLEKTEEG